MRQCLCGSDLCRSLRERLRKRLCCSDLCRSLRQRLCRSGLCCSLRQRLCCHSELLCPSRFVLCTGSFGLLCSHDRLPEEEALRLRRPAEEVLQDEEELPQGHLLRCSFELLCSDLCRS